MKNFWTSMSVTKLVLLIIVISLVTIELYKTFNWMELDQVFVDFAIMVWAFYYWQKGMKYEKVDSLLDDNNSKDGQD
jgi:hypothetical protein